MSKSHMCPRIFIAEALKLPAHPTVAGAFDFIGTPINKVSVSGVVLCTWKSPNYTFMLVDDSTSSIKCCTKNSKYEEKRATFDKVVAQMKSSTFYTANPGIHEERMEARENIKAGDYVRVSGFLSDGKEERLIFPYQVSSPFTLDEEIVDIRVTVGKYRARDEIYKPAV